jgi:hypothetical protein
VKAKELIELLEILNPDTLVIVQKDSEGNDYSPLESIETGRWVAENGWSGYPDDEGKEPAVFLVPIN